MSKGSVFLSPLLAVLLCSQSGLTASTPYQPRHPDPVLESWRWREFDQLRGLGVRSIAESVDGTMWFGLNEGVRSYDGVAWTTYGEEDGVLGAPTYVLQALRDGRICAGSEVGLSCFESGKWTRLFPPEGSIDFPITAMDEGADGRLWASSPWGALSVKGKEFTLYTSAGVISSLAELIPTLRFAEVPDRVIPYRPWAQAGTESFVFSRAGISLIWGRSIGTPIRTVPKTIRFVAKGSPAEAAGLTVGDRVHSIERGKLGTSPTAIGLTVYKPGRNDPVDVRVGQEILEGGSREFDLDDVFVAPNGTVWFGLYGGPVVSLSPGTEAHWQFYGEEEGLKLGHLPRITQATDGSIWVVSDWLLTGASRFDGRRWQHFDLRSLGGTNMNSSVLETSDGILWIGGGLFGKGGLASYDRTRDKWTFYGQEDVPVELYRTKLFESSDDALWVTGDGQTVSRLEYSQSQWTTLEGLLFQAEEPGGSEWFLSDDGGVVLQKDGVWTRFGTEDGLMDAPVRVIVTRNAGIWAAGSDDSTAATARFDGSKWALTRHPELSWGVDPGAVLESADGQSLYFGAAVDLVEGSRQIGGILRLDTSKPEQWTQLAPPLAPYSVYGLGEAPDDSFWAGGFWGLRTLEKPPLGQPPSSLTGAACGVLYSRPGGQLWIGTWTQALYSYDGREWKHHSDLEGLDEMRITSILETSDQSVWVTTQRGMYRFDGDSWIRDPLPIELKPELWKEVRPAEGGLLWVNSAEEAWFRRAWPGLTGEAASGLRTTRYRPDRQEPETEITVVIDEVAQPGNTIISWRGVDPWNVTPVDRLQYSYRLNGDDWSPFTFETSRVLLALEGGRHRFEVRSRDSDFNVDPTAATLSFLVVPSIWKQGWFQVLLLTFVAILVVLGFGLLRRERQLELSNEELKAANTALESFSYSVSHDLRSPLRSIDGFSRALLDDFSDKLDTEGTGHLSKIIAASQRMARLIDGLRRLSQLTRAELNHQTVDLSELSRSIVSELSSNEVDRRWDYRIEKGLETRGDPDLLRIALTNLVSNAVKFSRQAKHPFIEIGRETNAEKGDAFFVRDNGVGFEMEYAGQLFGLFNRLHRKSEFEGDGIGLAIVDRVVRRHLGRVWAFGRPGEGATFFFALNLDRRARRKAESPYSGK